MREREVRLFYQNYMAGRPSLRLKNNRCREGHPKMGEVIEIVNTYIRVWC